MTTRPDREAIEVEAVSHSFGHHEVLHDITVTLAERRVGIVGANGSGKSTFARLFNALVIPSQGRVCVDGLDTRREAGAIRRRTGFVFTDPDNQIVMPTVAEDVAFGLRRRKLSKEEVHRKVTETLGNLGLAGRGDHPAHLLSGGQKQLLALASVLVTDPAIIVCDEPTTLLDLRNTRRVGELLDQFSQRLVVVTHDLELLREYDRVLVFDEGRIVADDAPGPALATYRRIMT